MEIERKEQTAQMSQDVVQNNVSVEQDNVGFIINLMSSKLYKNRRAAFLREILSNAIDSNAEAKEENPVLLRIYLDENRKFHVQIRDYGVGLSAERFQSIYVNIGSSTKRKNNSQQGGFGIGRFSALSYANYASVTSFYEGIRYEYAMYHDGDSTSVPKLSEAPTDEPNGVLVDIAFKNIIDYEDYSNTAFAEIRHILALMLGRFSYFQNVFVEFDFDFNEEINIKKYPHICENKKRILFALDKINNNLVLNKKHYIFSKNAYVNGLNTDESLSLPYLDNNSSRGTSAHQTNVLHIVVGENVYYPLDRNEISKYLSSNSKYKEHVESKILELSQLNTEESKVLLKKYQFVLNLYNRARNRGAGFQEYLRVALGLPLGIKIPIGTLDILPNREEFIYNKATALKILDIIFLDFLPELEKDLALNNIKDFNNYKDLLDFYKDYSTYESIGKEDSLLMYINHEERLRIHLDYQGDFYSLSFSENFGVEVYKTHLSEPYSYTKDNFWSYDSPYNKIVLKFTGSKQYREFYYSTRSRTNLFNYLFFVTVKGKQVKQDVIETILQASVSDSIFEDMEALSKTMLFQEYGKGKKIEDLLNSYVETAVHAIGEKGQITKRFAKGKTSLTNGKNFTFREAITGKFSSDSSILVFADTENLKAIEKAYLMDQISQYDFTNHLSYKYRHDSNPKIEQYQKVGTSVYSPIVHFFSKNSIVSKEKFSSEIEEIIEGKLNSNYPAQSKIYSSPIELMKKMIKSMKQYQLFKKIQSDSEKREDAASTSLNKKIRQLREEKELLNDSIDILKLRINAIENNLGSYAIPTELHEGKLHLNWKSDLSTWKTINVSSSDYSTLEGLKEKFDTLNKNLEQKEQAIKVQREKSNKILSFIKNKYFFEELKKNGLTDNKANIISSYFENSLKNTRYERLALINRSSDIFTYPEDIRLLKEILTNYYHRVYDFMIDKLFVDFSNVTEVTPEFEEEYLASRKEERGSTPHEVVNIKQLHLKGNSTKGYDFITYKSTPTEFIEKINSKKGTLGNLDNMLFVYGNINKTKKDESSNLVDMFFYVNRFFERYVTGNSAEDVVRYFFSNSKNAPQFIFLDIPATKQKYFKDISNFIHIDDFMQNLKKYRQIRRMNTALLIESQAEGLIKFSSIINANPNIFRETTSNKIQRLARFMETNTSKLGSGLEQQIKLFKKDMLEKAIEENMFEPNIMELFKSCEKELKDMRLILACSQDVLETTFYSNERPTLDNINENKQHFKDIGWTLSEKSASLAKIMMNSSMNSDYRSGRIDDNKIHPILADFLVKVLKGRKNIIPTYQACNQSIVNLNS